MNKDEIRNITDAWGLAMYFYDRRESVWVESSCDDDSLAIRYVFDEEYRKWVDIYNILFNVAV